MRRLLSWLVLVVMLAALAPAIHAQMNSTPRGDLALLYVPLSNPSALSRVQSTGLPAYAHLQGLEEEYLLVGAGAAGQAALTRAGLTFRILDEDVAGNTYYLAYVMPGRLSPAWSTSGRLLLDDGVQVLVRAAPQGAERLAASGVQLQLLTLEAKPLPAGAGRSVATLTEPDPLVQLMIDQVDQTTIYNYTGGLSGEWAVNVGGSPYTIATRHTTSGTPIQKATQFAYEHLDSLGLDTTYHNWSAAGYSGRNVIAELPGEITPDDILIICAHIDDMPSGALAPGADDNASGSVGVLVAADILTQYQWGCTLRFALWTGEEQGLLGSQVYAQQAAAAGENILGVLNLDMIAWNSHASDPTIDLHARSTVPGSMDLAELFADVIDVYDLNLIPQILSNGSGASDHASFWAYDYPAILGIEDFSDFNPYYHTTADALSTLDMAYYTDFVRASVGTFAHMGCLIPSGVGTLEGTVTADGRGEPLSDVMVVATDAAGHSFSAFTGADGYYTRTLLTGYYTVTAATYGYLPALIPDVPIITDTVTTQNISLQAAPHQVISGTVTEVGTGIPLLAEISFQTAPVTATTDLWTGLYTATLPQGVYTMHVRAEGHRSLDRPVVVDRDQTQDFALELLPCILLVDDDNNGPDVRGYYGAALDGLGYDYDMFDVGGGGGDGPSLAELEGYNHVLWFSGDQFSFQTPSAGPNPADEANLATYLDGGGHLLLSSQDYLFDMGLTDFGRDYLGIAGYVNDRGDATAMHGVAGDPIGDGLGPYSLSYPLGFLDYGDALTVGTGALVAFRSSSTGGNVLVLDKDGGAWQTVFFGTSWVPIYHHSAANGTEVLERTIEWFGGCEPEMGVVRGEVVDGWSGEPLAGAALTTDPQILPDPQFADPAGYYTMTLPAGYYTLTASMEGYISQTVPGVLLLPGLSTVQDLVLDPERILLYLPLMWTE